MAKKNGIVVDAGNHDRVHCPVSIELDASSVSEPERLGLVLAGVNTAVQVDTSGNNVKLTWLIGKLGKGKSKIFDIRTKRALNNKGGVELVDIEGEKVSVFLNGKLLTNYYYGEQYPRPFLHPLNGPYNKTVTRDYPMSGGPEGERQDHPHHRSVWTAWGELNGTDNWSEMDGHARQVHQGFEVMQQGPIYGRLVARNHWVSNKGKKVCEEIREITFYNNPAATRMIDYNVKFIATEGSLHFQDTKEGGILSVRVASSMDVPVGGLITNGHNGINEKETWGKRAPWCDYSGTAHSKHVGVAIFDHPDNFRYPTYWHVRNYGLMTANPFGLSHFYGDKSRDGGHKIGKGEELAFKYRLIVHKDDPASANVSEHFHNFISPPEVTFG